MTNKITEAEITKLLEIKHSKDVFVSQCKTGSSKEGFSQMDAWAMKKSWAHPLVIVYEIKTSRSDFIHDDKWNKYLKYCNQLYFVCPVGVITLEELPPEVGLILISKNGNRLYTKKKAHYRHLNVPEDLFRYILMHRTHIVHSSQCWDRNTNIKSNQEYWKNWLKDKELSSELGKRVSKELRALFNTQIKAIKKENESLVEKMSEYDAVKEFLSSVGIDPENISSYSSICREVKIKIKELQEIIPNELFCDMDRLERGLKDFQKTLKNLKG